MNRLSLAQHLHRANVGPNADWSNLTEDGRQGYLREADAALSALKGPRTGEELYMLWGQTWRAHGSPFKAFTHETWSAMQPRSRAVWDAIAATFSTPPEPVGWPEGFSLAAVEMTPIDDPSREWLARVEWQRKARFCVYDSTREEAEERARLTAWTLASRRPVNAEPIEPIALTHLRIDYEALRAAVDGPGGYREQVDALKSTVQDATSVRLCLASHLTPAARKALRPGLLTILESTGLASAAEVDEAVPYP